MAGSARETTRKPRRDVCPSSPVNRSHATVVHEVSPYLSPYHPETRLSPEDSVAQPCHEWHVDG